MGIEDISDIIADFSHAFTLAIPDEVKATQGHVENKEQTALPVSEPASGLI